MNKQTRQFYTRYRMYTSIVPAYMTGILVFLTGWFTYNSGEGAYSKTVEIVAGMAFFVACTGGYELCSRLGFKQFRLQSYSTKLTTELKQQLAAVFNEEFAAGQGLHPIVVELGEVPMLMVGGDTPNQLWLSTHTLANTPAAALKHLLCHERAHLECDMMLDRVLITGGYWWFCGVGVMMLVSQPLIAALWLLAASGVFLHVNRIRLARLERRADKLAAKASTLEGYVSAMVEHLKQFETGSGNGLIRGRLQQMGLTTEQTDDLLKQIDVSAED